MDATLGLFAGGSGLPGTKGKETLEEPTEKVDHWDGEKGKGQIELTRRRKKIKVKVRLLKETAPPNSSSYLSVPPSPFPTFYSARDRPQIQHFYFLRVERLYKPYRLRPSSTSSNRNGLFFEELPSVMVIKNCADEDGWGPQWIVTHRL